MRVLASTLELLTVVIVWACWSACKQAFIMGGVAAGGGLGLLCLAFAQRAPIAGNGLLARPARRGCPLRPCGCFAAAAAVVIAPATCTIGWASRFCLIRTARALLRLGTTRNPSPTPRSPA